MLHGSSKSKISRYSPHTRTSSAGADSSRGGGGLVRFRVLSIFGPCAIFPIFAARKRRQGNVFTGVCQRMEGGGLPSMHHKSHDRGGSAYRGVGQTPPRTRKAGGMHPTGMLSCFVMFFASFIRKRETSVIMCVSLIFYDVGTLSSYV